MSSFVSPPPHWKVVKLGDIANVEFSSVDKKAADGEIPVVLCNYHDVVGNHRIRSGIDFMPATATAKEVDKWTLQQDDVIFTKDAEIGKVSLVEESLPNLVCGYHLGRARPKPNVVDGPFLAEALKTYDVQKQFTQLQTGLTISGIRLDDTKSIKVLLPSLDEQKNIASVLNDFERTIEQTENVIIKTAQLRDSLLYELLTRGLPGHHKEWKEVSGLGIIPTSWQVVRLGEICAKPMYGAGLPAQPYDPLLPRYIRITDISDDGQLLNEEARSVDPVLGKGYELSIGDILFARSGSVGRTYLYDPKDGDCIYAGYLIKFKPNPDVVYPEYIELWTRTQVYKRWVASIARVGAQPNINATEYSSMPLPLPTLAEQKKLANFAQSINLLLKEESQGLEAYRVLKNALSNKLLNGSIKVKSLLTDTKFGNKSKNYKMRKVFRNNIYDDDYPDREPEKTYLEIIDIGQWESYLSSYKKVAHYLTQYSNNLNIGDKIYPIAFLYRHYLEILLKEILFILLACLYLGVVDKEEFDKKSIDKRNVHNLLKIWNEIKKYWRELRGSDNILDEQDFRNFEINLQEFHELDPKAEAFRYPITRQGEPTIPSYRKFDLSDLYELFLVIIDPLELLRLELHEYLKSARLDDELYDFDVEPFLYIEVEYFYVMNDFWKLYDDEYNDI